MALQSLPPSATEYAAAQRLEAGAAVSSVLRSWRRMTGDFDASWAEVGPQILATMDLAQERITSAALAYVPTVIEDTGQHLYTPAYDVEPTALVGTAGSGDPTEVLAYSALVHAKTAVAAGATEAQALAAAATYLSTATGTLLSDTGRTAEKMAGNARRVTWYVRMLSPPSCGRCVILAGKATTASTAFDRHPGCDCRNIPQVEAVDSDLTVDANAYLDSLPSADELAKKYPDLTASMRREAGEVSLEDVLGSRANAQAWRDGADVNQLINAYRRSGAVSTAQQYSRTVKYTTSGTSSRGLAYRAMSQMRANQRLDARGRNIITTRRLMPETCYQIAKDPADARRLLRLYGWIL